MSKTTETSYGILCKKDVIPIEEPGDNNRCGEESNIGDKLANKAVQKCKQAKIVITHADPFEIFRMSTSDDDSEWKSKMIMVRSKTKGNN